MKCDCIDKLEDKACDYGREVLKDATDVAARLDERGVQWTGPNKDLRDIIRLNVTVLCTVTKRDGGVRVREIDMSAIADYCPFCGTKCEN